MKKLFFLFFSILLSFSLYSQCEWDTILHDDFEHNNIDPGFIQGTAIGTGLPSVFGAKNGSKGLYLNIVNNINSGDTIYDRVFDICPGFSYRLSAWVCSRWGSPCDVDINIIDDNGNNFYQYSGTIPLFSEGWMQVNTNEFVTSTSTIRLVIITNETNGWNGNDFAMDDILLEGCNRTRAFSAEICYNHNSSINLFDNILTNNMNGIWSDTLLGNGYLGTFNLNVNDTGSFSYWIQNGDCPDSTEEINIYYEDFSLNIKDTTMCKGQSISIFTPLGINFYVSEDSSITNKHVFENGGTYNLEITKNGCYTNDTINIQEILPPYLELGNDTLICSATEFELNPSTNATGFKWNDGSNGSTFIVKNSGQYFLTASIEQCITNDTINVEIIKEKLVLGKDTNICEGDFFTVNLETIYDDYSWSDGSKKSFLNIHYDGQYFVKVKKSNCVINSDTLNVTRTLPPQIIETTNDTLICDNYPLQLKVKAKFHDNLLWHDLQTDTINIVRHEGVYWVKATNKCGTDVKNINVKTEDCLCLEYIPNAFTPNGDKLNETFGFNSNCIPSKFYNLKIFNRWGNLLFESDDYEKKWDGYYKGKLCQTGVYSYILTYQYKNDNSRRTRVQRFKLTQ